MKQMLIYFIHFCSLTWTSMTVTHRDFSVMTERQATDTSSTFTQTGKCSFLTKARAWYMQMHQQSLETAVLNSWISEVVEQFKQIPSVFDILSGKLKEHYYEVRYNIFFKPYDIP